MIHTKQQELFEKRTCRICKAEKPLSDFYLRKDTKTPSYRTECRPCQLRMANKERHVIGGKEHLRELKYFPGEAKEGLVNIVIYDNKVSIVSHLKETYGLIIESHELAFSLKYIWQIVWGVSKSK